MVSEKLLAACQSSFGETSACILVTGASGFVGSEVAKTLSSLGHQVTMTGRNRYSAPRESDCLAFRRANLLDKRNIVDLCAGQDYVIHTAANTSPSATTEELYPANVEGTENIIAGCLEHGVKRLVHISSTAIYFDFQDRFDISDDHPLPKQFACGYAESKALAEQRVLEAVEQGLLNAFIVRARAVFGARDACLLPRFLRAYDAGRLRRIGDGENVSELTYIDNLVYGIILAMQRGESGEACTISGGEPVQLWELLERVLAETGRNKPLRSLSASKAMFFASILERLHRIRNKAGEPALTRYSVGLLSKSQTFSQSGASKKLGYLPIVKLSEGIDTTLKSMSACDEGHANASVKLHLQTTGYTSAKANLVEQYGERAVIKLHSAIAVLEHPEFGITLFDTGYSPSFYEATRKWPFQLLSKITPVVTYPSLSAASAVRNLGFEPEEVSRIIISHFHSDHVCGLVDFPEAEVIATQAAWDSVKKIRGFAALRRAIVPDLIPADLEKRICLFQHFTGPGFGPFARTQDLFGDGSIRLVELPGHAAGQIGAIVQSDSTQRKFLVADAIWTRRTIEQDLKLTRPFKMLASDKKETQETKERLVQFAKKYPAVEILPTHCPDVAKKYGFDAMIRERAD